MYKAGAQGRRAGGCSVQRGAGRLDIAPTYLLPPPPAQVKPRVGSLKPAIALTARWQPLSTRAFPEPAGALSTAQPHSPVNLD